MLKIKRLYTFILGTFLPVLLATFSVCLFIILMQFLWRYINDMVGKGVDLIVLGQLFFYAALTFIPMALPLSVLLASLISFGNLGEHMELLAMKASGISLIRIMKPLIIFAIFLVGISFVFQNNVLPQAKTKMTTILLSLKQKSPELDIPEGVFYKAISGYNIYVRNKDKETGMLRNIMIYDYSNGIDNVMVTVADSGRLKISENKKYLVLTLYDGESFENNFERKRIRNYNDKVSNRRETFSLRELLIEYDTNFNLADESIMGSRDLGKNVKALSHYVDSMQYKQDSINSVNAPNFITKSYKSLFVENRTYSNSPNIDERDTIFRQGFQHYYKNLELEYKLNLLHLSKSKTEDIKRDNNIELFRQNEMRNNIRSHKIQLMTKFSMAISCLLFFFIGAPLGTIIRKGGLGLPAVISVLLFILYYIIDTFGVKMAREGVWTIWAGVWFSSFVLAALGGFFTYKAVNDSTMLNPDAWKNILQKIMGKRESRNYDKKEVIIENPNYIDDIESIDKWQTNSNSYIKKHKRFNSYFSFWSKNFNDVELTSLVETMEAWIEDLRNSDETLIIGKIMDYPVIDIPSMNIFNNKALRYACGIIFPIGLIVYIWSFFKQRQIIQDIKTSQKINDSLKAELIKLKLNSYGI